MKKLKLLSWILLFAFWILSLNYSLASGSNSKWVNYEGDPEQFVESVQSIANKDFHIQETKLDNITSRSIGGGQRSSAFKITGTLEWIRMNIFPYIQWTVFIGLSIGAIMLIWNGFKLVTQSLSGEKAAEVKKDIQSVLIGIVILTGFLAIIQLTLGVLNIFFS